MITYRKISNFSNDEIEYILPNYLPFPKNSVGMISSKGGVGKSNLSIKLALQYVNENVGRKSACWFTEDDGKTIKDRALSMLACGIHDSFKDIDNVIQITSAPESIISIKKGEICVNYFFINDLIKFLKAENIGFLVIDPLISFFGGDENNNAHAKAFMQVFVELTNRLNLNIVILHHSNKGLNETRGAGAFVDAIRTLYEINLPTKKNEKKELIVDEELYRAGYRTFTLKKDNRNVSYVLKKLFKNSVFNGSFNYKIIPILEDKSILADFKNASREVFGEKEDTIFKKEFSYQELLDLKKSLFQAGLTQEDLEELKNAEIEEIANLDTVNFWDKIPF